MENYSMVIISVILFGVAFLFNEKYQKEKGSGLFQAFNFSLFSGLAGLVFLLIINGFKIEFTVFTLLMSSLSALNSLAFTFCSLKAFEKINLSLYSLFSMLGGMVLPFVVGVIFFGEEMTVAKGVCLVLVAISLYLTVDFKNSKKGGLLYYIGIFVLNGMAGVIATVFTGASFEKTSPEGFSILTAAMTVLISAVLMVSFWDKKYKFTFSSLAFTFGYGAINSFANFLLVLALARGFDASMQYPIVTGGVIITSTVISAFTEQKPKMKEIISVIISFVGILALTFIPI